MDSDEITSARSDITNFMQKAKESMQSRSANQKEYGNSLNQRLSVVEATLRLQDATGVSHLQQFEARPQAFGLASSAQPAIRRLRRQRNKALHGNSVTDRVAEIETRITSDQAGLPVKEEIAAFNKAHGSMGKGRGAFPQCGSCRARPAVSSPAFCGQCGHPFRRSATT